MVGLSSPSHGRNDSIFGSLIATSKFALSSEHFDDLCGSEWVFRIQGLGHPLGPTSGLTLRTWPSAYCISNHAQLQCLVNDKGELVARRGRKAHGSSCVKVNWLPPLNEASVLLAIVEGGYGASTARGKISGRIRAGEPLASPVVRR
jgi:hypothetical protein